MLKNIKDKAHETKEHYKIKRIERKRLAKEEEIKKEKAETKRLEKESQAIIEERNRLLNLDNKELMVEAILAIRGFYSDYIEMQNRIKLIQDKIEELEIDVAHLSCEMGSDSSSDDSDY